MVSTTDINIAYVNIPRQNALVPSSSCNRATRSGNQNQHRHSYVKKNLINTTPACRYTLVKSKYTSRRYYNTQQGQQQRHLRLKGPAYRSHCCCAPPTLGPLESAVVVCPIAVYLYTFNISLLQLCSLISAMIKNTKLSVMSGIIIGVREKEDRCSWE